MTVEIDTHEDPRLKPAVTQILTALHAKYGSNKVPLDDLNEIFVVMLPAVIALFPEISDADEAAIRKRVSSLADVTTDVSVELTAPDFKPWLTDALSEGELQLKRWYNYKSFLTQQGFAPQVLQAMDQATHEIVDLIGDPRISTDWKRKGLVIGDVQSGKTATYLGIVNKAADVGYKLVILLAGGTESLRKQTQFRVDEGVIGRDSAITKATKAIGVGRSTVEGLPVLAQGLTSYPQDFNKSAATSGTQIIDPNDPVPMIFVIKKNKTALENVITWLQSQEHRNVPMLLVDDESDYASINTKYKKGEENDPTLINQRIRELLRLAPRSSYMAFTATPFANVFIDHKTWDEALDDDLFPHDYISALASPSNYMGAEQYFGTTDEPDEDRLVFVEDAAESFPLRHKSTLTVPELPASLLDALRTFLVGAAIRELRGDRSARSMLINVSQFMRVQGQVHELVLHAFTRMKDAVELHTSSDFAGEEIHAELAALRESFETHYGRLGIDWPDVRSKLVAGVLDTSVLLINSANKLDPETSTKHMIAVGGNVLSRGLTLDGLTVSYFYRVVGAADTLLQMARWFGYRPGYGDLVRVWIHEDVANDFRYVSDVVAELRSQLREMKSAGKTPREFGLAVRKNPESLRITASNKQGGAETERFVVSLAGRRIETTKLPAAPAILKQNFELTLQLLADMEELDPEGAWDGAGKHLGKDGVDRHLVADFLERFGAERGDVVLGGAFLANQVRSSLSPKFNDWTIGVVKGDGSSLKLTENLELPGATERSVRFNSGSNPSFTISGKSSRLAGSNDLGRTFFDDEGWNWPEASSKANAKKSVYTKLPHPTLLLYFVEPKLDVKQNDSQGISADIAARRTGAARQQWASVQAEGVACLVAIKVAIPGAPGSDGADVEYLVNSAWRRQFGGDDLDDVDAEDFDE